MTEGTSQGLFVVVAIVIFGIFVGLTYTLFGSEGLSKDLKGIFETGTEQANKSLTNTPKPTIKEGVLYPAIEIKNVTNESYDIYIYGVPEDVAVMRFPTWSAVHTDDSKQYTEIGQDDLPEKWSTSPVTLGVNLGSGVWRYTVKNNIYGDYGFYKTDAYFIDSEGKLSSMLYKIPRILYNWEKQ